MAKLSGGPKNIGLKSIGFGSLVLAPIAAGVLIVTLKPAAKMVIKGSVLVGALVRTAVAAAVTTVKDLAAEVKAELDADGAKKRG